ncbi:cbb3-type cytochrome oxidase assembly protein CcoS [Paenalcaligenes suwonensis]|uniref:cbb3-type cytochrome oxidase assembly protein CcoS n=1 Tax=Paenalcaligenes suwonensis TaxID=1202713 RepID=UPI00140A7A91|nr:cbb3-type cytochrome oxidase assembly protein CcoS [Paenalcaligenes suwonensis]NHC61798.1 cbb3-type cytochrome oxidase assembly protein CcoS [Paenalcaligenes suwonensis]
MLESLFLLIPISLLFVIMIGVALWWAIFAGQFENSQSAGESILKDDDSTHRDVERTKK